MERSRIDGINTGDDKNSLFFRILRAGLWGKPYTSDEAENTDWERIYSDSVKQTVTGIMSDGISCSGTSRHIPENIRKRFVSRHVAIMSANIKLNSCVAEIFPLLERHGIRPFLLKGQGIAVNYMRPESRNCGDIDIYVGEEKYSEACGIMKKYGNITGEETESAQHFHFNRNGITIEIHSHAAVHPAPGMNRRLRKWIMERINTGDPETADINGIPIRLPSTGFNAVYLLYHLGKHFIHGGIGLRQVCDWGLFIYRHHNTIDAKEFTDDISLLGLCRIYNIFSTIAVEYLGIPCGCFPDYRKGFEKKACKAVEAIMYSGNFGQYDTPKRPRPSGYYGGKLHSFLKMARWRRRCFSAAPVFTIKYTFYSTLTSIKIALLHK